MYKDRYVFSQLMDFFPKHEFNKCVCRYNGNHRAKNFSCLDQYMSMAFAQLTGRESLRDIETCLRSLGSSLYHAGFRGNISRSTLADANENRDWRIYQDFAQVLIAQARSLYVNEEFGVTLDNAVYALDSTTIDLCLTLFPWAQFRKHKSAVKMHTLLDLKGSIPCFIHITSGKVHDVNVLDVLPLEAGAFYVMDKAYTDFERLYNFTKSMAFFITRAKNNLAFTRCNYRQVDKATGLRSDQTIRLKVPKSLQFYPDYLRYITYYDADTNKRFAFLTNNFTLDALTIALLYKCRWKIELFFKWIKQHLRIKAFFGTSENAVKTQIWIAVSIYLIVAIMKKEMNLHQSLYEILQILSILIFQKDLVTQVLMKDRQQNNNINNYKQLSLFDL
jgi:transposase